MTDEGIDFITATYALRKNHGTRVVIPGRFAVSCSRRNTNWFQEIESEDYTIITSDKALLRYPRCVRVRLHIREEAYYEKGV